MIDNYKKIFGSILLIVGTSIGAGMLGLPIATGLSGFIPSMGVFFICGTLMIWSAFLILEVIYVLKKNTNLISMARHTLGKWGVILTLFTFLGLFYALLSAYIEASGDIFLEYTTKQFENTFLNNLTPCFIILICFPLLLLDIRYVDNFNKIMLILLILTYTFLIFVLFKYINIDCLKNYRYGFFVNSLSITIVSFAFHPILPTISQYLKYNIRNISYSIIIGGTIPIIIYIIWEMILLGIIPITGDISISVAYKHGITINALLAPLLNNSTITAAVCLFSLLAILTSFLGISIASIDFFIDALYMKRTYSNVNKAILATYIPPVIFAYKFQKGFIFVLDYAGVFIIILVGILPLLMVYNLRYNKKRIMQFPFLSHKYIIYLGISIYIYVITFIVIKNLGFITIII